MISLYNDLLYGWNLLDFLFLKILVTCIFWNLFILFLLEVAMVFFLFFDSTHGLSFHFYLYNVKEENALHFENFEKSSFAFCLL